MDIRPDPAEALALLSDCIKVRTANPPGDEAPLVDMLFRRFQSAGLPTEVLPLAPGRSNLLARLQGTGERPPLVLSGHTDTVGPGEAPWTHDPWAATVVDDRIYGRGACDMKSGLAAMAVAMILLRRAGVTLRGDLVFAASAGEEVDRVGARAFVASGALAGTSAIVVGEPTGGQIAVAHKGAAWLTIAVAGRTAHGSTPEQGINAILRMQQVIDRVTTFSLPPVAHPRLGAPTLSVNTIQGGTGINQVPDRCRLGVDIRTVPGVDHDALVDTLRESLGTLGYPVDVTVLASCPPVQTDETLPIVRTSVRVATDVLGYPAPLVAVPYFTDASVYQPALRVPVIIAGPGEARVAHQTDEWVSVRKYLDAIRLYAGIALTYLG
jgi:succinyl-diaminopimelate desuccinylase